MALSEESKIKDDDSGLEWKTVAFLVAFAFVLGVFVGVAIIPLVWWMIKLAFWIGLVVAAIAGCAWVVSKVRS